MTSRPPETASWNEPADAEAVVRDLKDQLAVAKARMEEHRDQMRAAGLTLDEDDRPPS